MFLQCDYCSWDQSGSFPLKVIFVLWRWDRLQNYKKSYYLVCIDLGNYVHIRKKKPFSLWYHQMIETTLSAAFFYREKFSCPLKKPNTPWLDLQLLFWFWLHCEPVTLENSDPILGDNTKILIWLWLGGAVVWKLCWVEVQILKLISIFLQLFKIKSFLIVTLL